MLSSPLSGRAASWFLSMTIAACRSLTGEEVMGPSLDGGRLRGCRTPQQAQDAGGGVIDQVFVEPARMHGSDDVVI